MEPKIPERRSRRLRGFNYAAPALYFVTLCTQGKRCLFGEIVDGKEHHSEAGAMVLSWWGKIPEAFPHVRVHEVVLMPNHLHGVVRFLEASAGGPPVAERASLGRIVAWFKTRTTNTYARGVRGQGWPPFDRRLWQRNYHEHIVRNEDEYAHAVGYIRRNPARWSMDPLHR